MTVSRRRVHHDNTTSLAQYDDAAQCLLALSPRSTVRCVGTSRPTW